MKLLVFYFCTFLFLYGCADSGYHPHYIISHEEVAPEVVQEDGDKQ